MKGYIIDIVQCFGAGSIPSPNLKCVVCLLLFIIKCIVFCLVWFLVNITRGVIINF